MGHDVPSSPLVTSPSFTDGVASLFDFAGANLIYAYSETPDEADAQALARDWEMVSKDISSAVERHR